MESIKRSDINEQWAHSGIVEAGDFAFISYCVGNIGQHRRNLPMSADKKDYCFNLTQ